MRHRAERLEAAVNSLLQLRSEILPTDDPATWREPLFGAIDSLRAYLPLKPEDEGGYEGSANG
jgi:hypothetical protein